MQKITLRNFFCIFVALTLPLTSSSLLFRSPFAVLLSNHSVRLSIDSCIWMSEYFYTITVLFFPRKLCVMSFRWQKGHHYLMPLQCWEISYYTFKFVCVMKFHFRMYCYLWHGNDSWMIKHKCKLLLWINPAKIFHHTLLLLLRNI